VLGASGVFEVTVVGLLVLRPLEVGLAVVTVGITDDGTSVAMTGTMDESLVVGTAEVGLLVIEPGAIDVGITEDGISLAAIGTDNVVAEGGATIGADAPVELDAPVSVVGELIVRPRIGAIVGFLTGDGTVGFGVSTLLIGVCVVWSGSGLPGFVAPFLSSPLSLSLGGSLFSPLPPFSPWGFLSLPLPLSLGGTKVGATEGLDWLAEECWGREWVPLSVLQCILGNSSSPECYKTNIHGRGPILLQNLQGLLHLDNTYSQCIRNPFQQSKQAKRKCDCTSPRGDLRSHWCY
jgi:hypothetical protein